MALGLISWPKKALGDLLALCPAVQSSFGANVKIWSYKTTGAANLWPVVIVTYAEGNIGGDRDTVGAGFQDFEHRKTLTVVFEKTGEPDDEETFINAVEQAVKEMLDLSGPAQNNVIITEWSLSGYKFDDNLINDPDAPETGVWAANIKVTLQ